jgi:hypothetical protein
MQIAVPEGAEGFSPLKNGPNVWAFRPGTGRVEGPASCVCVKWVGNLEFQPCKSCRNAVKAVLFPFITKKGGIGPDVSAFIKG